MNPYPLARVPLVWCLAVVAGCAGPAVSPSDQTLIREADQLHTRLAPAVVERRDARLQRYLEQIGARICAAAKELDEQGQIKSKGEGANTWMFSGIEFHLVNSRVPNSFTSGGRHVYVYDGLYRRCQNEDELAALFCHEYAHLYARHIQHELKRDPALPGEDALIFPFATLRLTPSEGRAADAIAFSIYVKAGWDPGRFADLYRRLLQEESVPGLDTAVLREKLADAEKRASDLPASSRDWQQPPVADESRFVQLQVDSDTLVTSAPRNERAELLLASFPTCLTRTDTPGQTRARQQLFPPPPAPNENKWNKGLQGAR